MSVEAEIRKKCQGISAVVPLPTYHHVSTKIKRIM